MSKSDETLFEYPGTWRISEIAVEPKQYNWMRPLGGGPMTVVEAGKLIAAAAASSAPAPVKRFTPARDEQGNIQEKAFIDPSDSGWPPRVYVLTTEAGWMPKHRVDCLAAAPAPSGGPPLNFANNLPTPDDHVRYVGSINDTPYGQSKRGGYVLLPPGDYSSEMIGWTPEEIQDYWRRGGRLDGSTSPPPAVQAAPRCGCGAAAVGCPHASYCDLYVPVPVAACGPHSDADDEY